MHLILARKCQHCLIYWDIWDAFARYRPRYQFLNTHRQNAKCIFAVGSNVCRSSEQKMEEKPTRESREDRCSFVGFALFITVKWMTVDTRAIHNNAKCVRIILEIDGRMSSVSFITKWRMYRGVFLFRCCLMFRKKDCCLHSVSPAKWCANVWNVILLYMQINGRADLPR